MFTRSAIRSVGTSALVAASMLAAAGVAQAHEEIFGAPLTGAAEIPAVTTPASGWAKVTFDLDLITMRVEVSFVDLIGNTTAAHIHANNLGAPITTNFGVATQVPSFIGFPLGVKSGSYDSTFDMTLASSYNPAFVAANGGTLDSAFEALLNTHRQGRAYFNLHTAHRSGGEIRGYLPTPGAASLLVLGGVVAGRRRRA
jgi:hypothetical protein